MTVGYAVALARVAFLATLLAGCAGIEAEKQPVSDTHEPTHQEILARLARRNAELKSLRSLARISYRIGEEKGGFQGAIVVHRPDRLRLEAFSMFGTALVVTADADAVTGFHTRENRFYRGKSSRENLFRYTQMLLDLKELTALLVGMPPVEADSIWEINRNIMERRRADGSLDVVELNGSGLPVSWQRFKRNGGIEFTAGFQEFSSATSLRFPLKISFAAPALGRVFEVRYDEPEINADVADSLFVQSMPDSAVEVPLESLGG